MTQVLYRKWRPMTFDQVVGQDHVTQTLCNALALGRVGHAYLFSGPRGTGKTTTARLLAKAVNCLAEELADRPCNSCRRCQAVNEGRFLDLIEIDAASNTGVDDIRDLREKIGFAPNEGRYKIYIVDEAHMLSTAAFNALLKTLEEPPPHAIFVLATTEAHKIPATVLSRCQRFKFRRIPLSQIVARLERVLGHEGAAAEPAALDLIARQATGALRDAESLLDQLLSSQSGVITLGHAQALLGTASDEAIERIVAAWVAGDPAAGMGAIQQSIEAGTDPRQFSRQLVGYLRGVLFLKTSGAIPSDLPEGMHASVAAHARDLGTARLIDGVRRFSAAVAEIKGGWHPQLPLELAFLECVAGEQDETARKADRTLDEPRPDAVHDESAPAPSGAALERTPQAQDGVARQDAPPPERPRHELPAHPLKDERPVLNGPLSPELVQSRWAAFLEAVKRHDFRVEAMLRSGDGVLGVEDGVVVLGFRYSLHREKMETEEWRRAVEDGLSEAIGIPLRFRCVDPQTYHPSPSGAAVSDRPSVLEAEQAAESSAASPVFGAEEIEELKRFGTEDLDAQIIEDE